MKKLNAARITVTQRLTDYEAWLPIMRALDRLKFWRNDTPRLPAPSASKTKTDRT